MKPQEWADWLAHPVTQAVITHLNEQKDSLIEQLINLPVGESVESYGLKAMALRYALSGMGAFLDLDDLKESLVEVNE
jgi:hypothetical protein